MADPVSLFVGISAGFDTLKKGLEAFKDAGAIKDERALREKVLEWRTQVIELKEQVLSLREAMQAQKEESLLLKERLAEKERALVANTSQESDVGYSQREDGLWEKEGRLYCPKCHATTKKWVQMTQQRIELDIKLCPVCNFSVVNV